MKHNQVAIIGGGPAGMITAIQLRRYGLEPVLFEAKRMGGLLWNANLVENYPGFPGGIPGPELAGRIIEQFEAQGLKPVAKAIARIDFKEERFLLGSGDEVQTSEIVVIATGTQPNKLPKNLYAAKLENTIFYEVADLLNIHHSKIAIIGAGDAAFDYALNLSKRENQILILNRGEEIKSLQLLVERARNDPNISYHANAIVSSIKKQEDGLRIETVDGDGEKAYKVDMLLAAIGRSATRPEFTDRLQAEEANLIRQGRLHLIGDVHNGIYRQTAIAVGDGLKAAMKIYQFLLEKEP